MKRMMIVLSGIVFLSGCGTEQPVEPDLGSIPVATLEREQTDSNDWCAGHGLPESMCTKCNPELIAGFKESGDWCAGHGYPESACPTCNPMTPPGEAVVVDWCGGHSLPESMCTKCNPELTAGFKAAGDWCGEHGYPESACPTCNPMTPPGEAVVVDWCTGHGLPESMCTKCNPELIAGFQESGDWCGEHGYPESACPTCNPVSPPDAFAAASIEARIVRFRSPEIEQAAGIQTVAVASRPLEPRIRVNARVEFDPDRVADIRALVPGLVRRIHVAVGDEVEVGDPLFTLESTRVGDLQAMMASASEHLRVAIANLERMRTLRERGIATARQVELAEGEVASERAERQAIKASLELTGAGEQGVGRYTLTAPSSGTVSRRDAVLGAHATLDMLLARIVDTQTMWLQCSVPERAVGRLITGTRAEIAIDGASGEPIDGLLTWIAPEVDPRTRMVPARVEASNSEGRLRANQFVTVSLDVDRPRLGLAVPSAAIQAIEDREVVFVRSGPGVYQPRVVARLGGDEPVWVEGNLRPGERVVTTGAVLLRTEVLPGSIGAGCCEVEPLAGEPR